MRDLLLPKTSERAILAHNSPESGECRIRLKAVGLKTAILSNGSPDLLGAAVNKAGIGHLIDAAQTKQGWVCNSRTGRSSCRWGWIDAAQTEQGWVCNSTR